jgi:hypothetical protein
MPKRYLNWEEVNQNWEAVNVNWEDVFVIDSGNAETQRWIEDNPWNKTWNKPIWRELPQQEKNRILSTQKRRF